uniref:hypothetical protein n=1 Tax=Stenotrophomonas maltophilia TaxID=40324 RepID=UPI001954CCCC
ANKTVVFAGTLLKADGGILEGEFGGGAGRHPAPPIDDERERSRFASLNVEWNRSVGNVAGRSR